jgi:hypothetical protein
MGSPNVLALFGARQLTKGKYLVERLLVSDQPRSYKPHTGTFERLRIHRKALAQRGGGVVAQALAVGNGYQKEVKRRCFVA